LNQIKFQSKLLEQLRQVKYLKDQFELKGKTNFVDVIGQTRNVFFENRPAYPLKLSLEQLHTDASYDSIIKVSKQLKGGKKLRLPVAAALETGHLEVSSEVEVFINLNELYNSFNASGNHLFDFIMNYRYQREVSFEEKLTIFCQTVSIYENELDVRDSFQQYESFEYAIVYPK
jgi:hypothetical protein